MEEIKQQIRKIIESEYKDALKKGLLDSRYIVNKIWKLLVEKEIIYLSSPEAVYGCYENFDETES
jgi:hypothetical protein